MGRLGEGGSEEGSDAAGVRKVPVVTVGRDGTIQPPSAEEETRAVVSVPGLTVIDGLGAGPSPTRSAGPADHGTPPVQMVASSEGGPVSVGPPKKPAKVTAEDDFSGAMQTKETVTPKADPPPKKVKVAAATPADAPVATGPKPTGAGYVAVLASVPASNSSRIDALKQFADMQQKYSVILQNKTPDVQEANLGEKGTYHRLLVGPPGSRDSASSLCTQLKAQGYSGCWVTAY
jgi:cell division septation protein DedD